jgi:hypothetical protein
MINKIIGVVSMSGINVVISNEGLVVGYPFTVQILVLAEGRLRSLF